MSRYSKAGPTKLSPVADFVEYMLSRVNENLSGDPERPSMTEWEALHDWLEAA